MADTRSLGRTGEEAAALHLEKNGYRIIERNARIGRSEIDIICEKNGYLVFAEVKTRHQSPDEKSPFGSPATAMDSKKQNALIRGADGYIEAHPTDKIPRIDVIEVYVSDDENFTVTEIRHFENAVRRISKFAKNKSHRRFPNETD